MFIAVISFVAILGTLILVHEFGHFIMAKRAKARVEEFGIGFPPRVFGVKKGETIYSINMLPIGGFVKIFGEDGDGRKDPKSFGSKSIATRSLIIAAGVIMNFLMAAVLLSLGHMVGLPQVVEEGESEVRMKNVTVRVADVAKGSPAADAHFSIGDIIYSMRATNEEMADIKSVVGIQDFINRYLGDKITIAFMRGEEIIEAEIVPRINPPEGEGPIGFSMIKIGHVSYPIYLAPLKGIESTALVTWGTLKGFTGIVADFISRGEFKGDLAGPIGIAAITGQVQKMGFVFLLQFVALISINLAVINVLPFPALDGGRLLFLAIEKIKGSPVKQKYEKLAHTMGFAVLIALMILVTFRDIVNLR